MKVLIACEESQRVCIAFHEKGHEAYSCDIQECSGGHPEWHAMCDVLPLLNGRCEFTTMDGLNHKIDGKWDLIIAHPPCTYLTCAGSGYFNVEKYGDQAIERIKKRDEAFKFVNQIWNADCDYMCLENPVGYLNSYWQKPDQIIHPYFFAKNINDKENYQLKRTCLWLRGLPKLNWRCDLPKPQPIYIDNTPKQKKRYFVDTMSGKDKAKKRSKTFFCIAKAMAEQWG